MIKVCFVILVLFTSSLSLADPRLIIHLSDYLANDYPGAVSEAGEVLSTTEYAEQIEFCQRALQEVTNDPKLSGNAELVKDINLLLKYIKEKTPPRLVVPLSRKIQASVVELSKIVMSPDKWPDYQQARKIFEMNCVGCHGVEGRGDGPDGTELDPPPANFHDTERAKLLSPFSSFNTIRLGVEGTGMPPFPDLSDSEVWSLAFYVKAFPYGKPKESSTHHPLFSKDQYLQKAAELNDIELRKFLALTSSSPDQLLSELRLHSSVVSDEFYIETTIDLLEQSAVAMGNKQFDQAHDFSIKAYFNGFEPLENKLKAANPELVTQIEESMFALRQTIKEENQHGFDKLFQRTIQRLMKIKIVLEDKSLSNSVAFLAGFSIILREGFEAVLVLLAILGAAKASGSILVVASIHSGWIISVLIGVLSWFVTGWLFALSGLDREVLEALTAILAVFILIYVGFWMHRQTEIKRWQHFINVKIKNLAQTKNVIGLFLLSFIVTFREVIETVLFLRSIYFEANETARFYIFSGVVTAFVIVMIVSLSLNKYRNKISLKKFFTVSSVLLMFMATTLTGKAVHALQEAGWVSITHFPWNVRVEVLGIFPSCEALGAQVGILILSLLIWAYAGKKS